MEEREFYSHIQTYAVRIGLNDSDRTLFGSGTLFPVEFGQAIYVLTAAHVALPLKKKMEQEGQVMCLTCKDNTGELHNIIVDNLNNVLIHSKYDVESDEKNNQEYFHDVAIIQVSWESWMEHLKGFRLEKGELGITVSGYGFPESLDDEKNKIFADAFAGVSRVDGCLESINAGRSAIRYDANVEAEVMRDYIMKGYSGTGLFSMEEHGICLRGVISCSRGSRAAGYNLWSIDADIVFELMSENDIKIGYPDSFQPYRDVVVDEFATFRTTSIRQWKTLVDKILDDGTVVPDSFEKQVNIKLPCEGNRKICVDFWKELLKELVILYGVQQIPKEQLNQPMIQLPSPYENENVAVEFLCTELNAEHILGKMIEDKQFSKEGDYYNNMIMLINGKKGHNNCTVLFPRKDCRNIMTNIAGQYKSCTVDELEEKITHLIEEGDNNSDFDIIIGTMENCNIAAIGTSKVMEILNKDSVEEMKQKMDSILIELWEES